MFLQVALHASRRQAFTEAVEKQGFVISRQAALFQIALQGIEGMLADRDDALLPALPQNPDQRLVVIDRADIKTGQFTDPQTT